MREEEGDDAYRPRGVYQVELDSLRVKKNLMSALIICFIF